MIARVLQTIMGTANVRKIKKLRPIVEHINGLEARISSLGNDELAAKTGAFKEQIARGKSLEDILPEAFAVVREVSKRELGQRHFDVQLMGGMVLYQGSIAEMKTGEGKTLTATLPLYLTALEGKGAHLVTVNDYLARRDGGWMAPIYNRLGLSVGVLQNHMHDMERKQVYQSDIVYATNNELGFDYLRDNMKFRLEDYVQRDLHYAIVDEVDSILIDEARTPLIISGASDQSSQLYVQANAVIPRLTPGTDYEIDEKARSVQLTEAGADKVEAAFRIDNLYALENLTLLHHINQALRAHALYKKDVEYVVKDNHILIVDEFTGRILPGRRYSDGLHQALEAKEGVTIERESQTLASITLQNFFRLYTRLAGMTGTAMTEAEEFYKIYKLDVVSIPTNQPMIRIDYPDIVFLTKNAKYKAIVQEIQERHAKGQPILIGTIAIETSEYLSSLLHSHNIPHEVLNAKQHEREAEIVAHAGERGHVTIATNMAGRGTDIKLTPESKEAGGLFILGTERHESRRIDNQLRGRSGRQGDPGASRFYISVEDDLFRIFGAPTMKKQLEWAGMQESESIESKLISKSIEHSQEKVEKKNFDARKHLLEYDDVLNQQRIVVYKYRKLILIGQEDLFEFVQELLQQAMVDFINAHWTAKSLPAEDLEKIYHALSGMVDIGIEEIKRSIVISTHNKQQAIADINTFLLIKYESFHQHATDRHKLLEAERWMMLEIIDNAWKQHMLNLGHLKEGIELRSWGQKNPLIEYKKEAFAMFQETMQQIRWDIVHNIFHLNVEKFNQQELAKRRHKELEELNLMSAAIQDQGPLKPVERQEEKRGRNEPCPCGSGKKYKKCCGA